MTDFLLVHGEGQGAWIWGKVWGHLTAPVDHPPRLDAKRPANRVCTLDLPGHGADTGGDTAQVRMEECVYAIARTVEREGLKDLVMVGHGFAGSLIIQAVSQLPQPPKRLILVAGIVPTHQKNMLGAIPRRTRAVFNLLDVLSKFSRQDLKFPKSVIASVLCNGMGPMEVVEVLGLFGPLPTRVLKTKVPLEDSALPCPVTYVELTRDRLLPPNAQQRMAQRLPGVEIVTLDSCHQVMLQNPKEMADMLLTFA